MSKSPSYAQWSLEPYCIGLKLRSLRMQKRLTLSGLAAETGLSTALLSKLETDRMIPTLPTLATISRVYGVGLSHFFSEPARHTLSITRKAHLTANHRTADPVRITPLSGAGPGTRIGTRPGTRFVAQLVELEPGPTKTIDSARQVSGMIYVLEGRLRLDAGGMQEVLEAGDCACMESEMPLAWAPADKHRCRMLVVLAPSAEQQ